MPALTARRRAAVFAACARRAAPGAAGRVLAAGATQPRPPAGRPVARSAGVSPAASPAAFRDLRT